MAYNKKMVERLRAVAKQRNLTRTEVKAFQTGEEKYLLPEERGSITPPDFTAAIEAAAKRAKATPQPKPEAAQPNVLDRLVTRYLNLFR